MRAAAVIFSVALHGAMLHFAGRTRAPARPPPTPTSIRVREIPVAAPEPVEPAPEPEAPPPPPQPPPQPRPPPPAPPPAAPQPHRAPPPPPARPPRPPALVMDAGGGGGGVAVAAAPANENAGRPAEAAPPPKPKPRRRTPKKCGEKPGKPKPLEKIPFDYPHAVRADGVEGRLIMRLHVDSKGKVSKVEVLRAVDPRLDSHAVQIAQRWRFTPASACGRAVASTYTLARRFELGA